MRAQTSAWIARNVAIISTVLLLLFLLERPAAGQVVRQPPATLDTSNLATAADLDRATAALNAVQARVDDVEQASSSMVTQAALDRLAAQLVTTDALAQATAGLATKQALSAATAGVVTQSALTQATANLVSQTALAQATSGLVTTTTLNQAKADMDARTCAPGTTAPQADAVTASAGAATTCLRSDARLPRTSRAAVAITNAAGVWSITWQKPLPEPPMTLPVPLNNGTQPVICNATTSTELGATGRCWLARPLPATLLSLSALLSFDPMAGPASGLQVQVLAIPLTQ